jgi:hypothetical protein
MTASGTGNMCVFVSEHFIELVLKKSFLYDAKDKKHSNRDIAQKAWEDIAKEMGCESERYLNPNYSSNNMEYCIIC